MSLLRVALKPVVAICAISILTFSLFGEKAEEEKRIKNKEYSISILSHVLSPLFGSYPLNLEFPVSQLFAFGVETTYTSRSETSDDNQPLKQIGIELGLQTRWYPFNYLKNGFHVSLGARWLRSKVTGNDSSNTSFFVAPTLTTGLLMIHSSGFKVLLGLGAEYRIRTARSIKPNSSGIYYKNGNSSEIFFTVSGGIGWAF